MDGLLKLSERMRREAVHVDERTQYVLPAGGVIEEIELRPLTLALNTDARAPYRLVAELWGSTGRVPLDVVLVVREIDAT